MRRKRNVQGVCVMHNYAGYGMTADRAKALLKECREGKHTELVRTAAQQAAPGIERWLTASIIEGESFDRMAVKWEMGEAEIMPCCRNSFYDYRKLTLAILDRMLPEKGAVRDGQL